MGIGEPNGLARLTKAILLAVAGQKDLAASIVNAADEAQMVGLAEPAKQVMEQRKQQRTEAMQKIPVIFDVCVASGPKVPFSGILGGVYVCYVSRNKPIVTPLCICR